MIRVTLYKNEDGGIYRFKVLNHGSDIVCAGVSALVITCVNFIQARFGNRLEIIQEYADMGGHIDFEVSNPNSDVALVIDQMVFGLEQIREVHSNGIKITTKTGKR
jgi:hypothetical protein